MPDNILYPTKHNRNADFSIGHRIKYQGQKLNKISNGNYIQCPNITIRIINYSIALEYYFYRPKKQNCDLSKFSMISQSKNYDNFINTFGNSGEILKMP